MDYSGAEDVLEQRQERQDDGRYGHRAVQPRIAVELPPGLELALARLRRIRDRIDREAVLRGETGDQTDQESRSAGPRAATNLTVVRQSSDEPH
jgi:hypothetical protein